MRLPSVVLGLFMVVFLSVSPVVALDLPNQSNRIDLNAREQDIAVFLDAVFQQIQVPLSIAEGVEGTINGRFSGSVREVLDDVSAAFSLVIYFDGAVAYVYNANQTTRRVFPASSAQQRRAIRTAEDLGLMDARNSVSAERTGLLVSGTPRFVEQIEEILDSAMASAASPPPRPPVTLARPAAEEPSVVEVQSDIAVYKVYRLKHAWANDTSFQVGNQSVTVPGVASILQNLITTQPVSVALLQNNGDNGRGSLQGLRGTGLQSRSGGNQSAGNGSVQGLANSEANSDLIRIVADTRLNAVIVRDVAERIPAYDSLIESLDVESKMVEIEATIIDINTDRTRELGVNWRFNNNDVDILIGQGGDADQALQFGSDLASAQGRGGVLSFMLGEPTEFLSRIRLLEEQGAAKVVSKPHVITLSDVEAVLGASTEFFVRVAGDEEVDLFNVPVGTFLRVTPHVFEDRRGHRIKLLVNIEDGTQAGSQTVDSIPVVERANINTQAVINEGDSLLIGGLVRESFIKSDYRVPLLGSIPVIGRLFRSDRNSSTRVERLFMITPRVASGLGFDEANDQPGLVGNQNTIVNSAVKRTDDMSWPEDKRQPYWPDRGQNDNNVPARPAARGRNQNGVEEFVSPFIVEAWSASAGHR